MNHLHQKYKNGEITRREYRDILARRNGFENRNERENIWNHERGKCQSMYENKECTNYLGTISEKYLSYVFDNVIRMPNCNRGYDFLCGKGYKIDVKSSCICKLRKISSSGVEHEYDVFYFGIEHNKIADYFLFLAYDNFVGDRDNLKPKYVWLIKGTEIIRGKRLNDFGTFRISLSKIYDFRKYELTDKLEKLKECYNRVKNEQ